MQVSGAINARRVLAIVMSDANPLTVDSLGMSVDGNALAVTNTMGAKGRFRPEVMSTAAHLHHHRWKPRAPI